MSIDINAAAASVYCERSSPEFWAEPLNAMTSLIVIGVAIVGYIRLRRLQLLCPAVTIMMILAGLIGVGSFLLHTFATWWAEVLDLLPIWAFVAFYGLAAIQRVTTGRFSLPLAAAFSTSVFASGAAFSLGTFEGVTLSLSGSTQYIPALMMIACVLWFLLKNRHPSLPAMAIGVGLFALALTFRSLDLQLCSRLPTGTHFIWHLSNCLVFWYLIKAFAVYEAELSISVAK